MKKFEQKSTTLGIELGSTRIKAVLAGPDGTVLAGGAHDWENRFEGGYWTYHLDDVWAGIQDAYRDLARDYENTYGEPLTTVGALGVSAMMHGYLPFDKEGNQLAAFRTWRNTTTQPAAEALTERFRFNIPQRWSVAHLYQAILNGEDHVKGIAFLTTCLQLCALASHWREGAGHRRCLGHVPPLTAASATMTPPCWIPLTPWQEHIFPAACGNLLPKVLCAGQDAGCLTEAGARLLDPAGTLPAGIPVCPPEGDAGTGMAATNSVAQRTGNVSAGTSVFAMVVLEKPLKEVHPEIDMVTTPDGAPVAMVHCNTCTSDLDGWVKLLGEMAQAAGVTLTKTQLYTLFYQKALQGDADCGGLVNFNYFSGEPVTGVPDGRPLFVRRPDAKFNLANFARAQLYACMATLKYGLDILFEQEQVTVDNLLGHGGLFKVPVVGQKLLAGALGVPVSVMKTAGEGGPWGMALLAGYRLHRREDETLESYLRDRIFADAEGSTLTPRRTGSPRICRFYGKLCPLPGGGTCRCGRTAVNKEVFYHAHTRL